MIKTSPGFTFSFAALAMLVLGACGTQDDASIGSQRQLIAVTWANPVGVIVNGSNLTKNGTTGWNAGAASTETLTGDGYVQFTTAENTTWKMAGISNGDTDQGFKDIDFAFYLAANGIAYVYENGVYRTLVGPYAANDVFRVSNTGGTVKYYQNDVRVYTSTGTATLPLVLGAVRKWG